MRLSTDVRISAFDRGQTIGKRARRAIALVRTTQKERGSGAALRVAGRLVARKLPLVFFHMRAATRVHAIRGSLSSARADSPDILAIGICVTGGLGDLLVIARFLRDLLSDAGEVKVDVFSPTPGIARWVFGGLSGFRAAYHDILFNWTVHDYDLAIRVSQFAALYDESIRWSNVRKSDALMAAIDNLIRFRPQIDGFVENHPWFDNFLARKAVFSGEDRRTFMHRMAGLRYGGDQFPVPADRTIIFRHGLEPKRYITVHNGFDPGFVISGRRATKCYPHFGEVVRKLRSTLPDIKIVQVGVEHTSEPIPECDLVLIGKTSLEECAGLIAEAKLHIDNEGGLVHLASCLGVQAAVVFGPTPSDYFGYPGNINIDPPVCGGCWWMTRTWMDSCPKGYSTPRCLTEQDPLAVANAILKGIRPERPQDSNALVAPKEFETTASASDLAAAAGRNDIAGKPKQVATPTSAGWKFAGHPDQAFGAVTYSQFGEDLILVNIFRMLGIEHPGFIDVGAHHPVNISNTALLYTRGSRGINIEANPNLIEAFFDLRPEDVTVNVGIGAERGVLDFYMIDDWSGRNTFDRLTAEQFVESNPEFAIRDVQKISVITLDDAVAAYSRGKYPPLLCIDAEGLDYDILAAARFGSGDEKDGPLVICVEAVSGDDQDSSERLKTLLGARGYQPLMRTTGNLLFIRASEIDRLRN